MFTKWMQQMMMFHDENFLSCKRKRHPKLCKFVNNSTTSGWRRGSQRLKRDGYQTNMQQPRGLQKFHLMKEDTKEVANPTNATFRSDTFSNLIRVVINIEFKPHCKLGRQNSGSMC